MRFLRRRRTLPTGTPPDISPQEQLAELQRHPVGSVEGYNTAYRHYMQDPKTLDDRCSCSTEDRKVHEPHLWRLVAGFGPWSSDVDERMRRCDGQVEPQ